MARVRVDCSGEYATTWVEWNTRWSRQQIEAWEGAEIDEKAISALAPFVAACHIELLDGTFLDDPAQITWDFVNSSIDDFILIWLAESLTWAAAERRILGKMSPRVSSASKDAIRAAILPKVQQTLKHSTPSAQNEE